MSDLSLEEFNELTVHFGLSIGFAGEGQRHETLLSEYVDYERWILLNDDDKDDFISEIAQEWGNDYIDLGAYVE